LEDAGGAAVAQIDARLPGVADLAVEAEVEREVALGREAGGGDVRPRHRGVLGVELPGPEERRRLAGVEETVAVQVLERELSGGPDRGGAGEEGVAEQRAEAGVSAAQDGAGAAVQSHGE